jgi:hypothetical protein
MRLRHVGIVAAILTIASVAFAQESEFQGKIQEDLDGQKAQVIYGCGMPATLTLHYQGKLGSNPREPAKPNYNGVSALCTSAVGALNDACQTNAVVKGKESKITSIICTTGHGAMDYSISGTTETLKVDPSFTTNNASGERRDLVEKLKKDMDK